MFVIGPHCSDQKKKKTVWKFQHYDPVGKLNKKKKNNPGIKYKDITIVKYLDRYSTIFQKIPQRRFNNRWEMIFKYRLPASLNKY